MTSVIATKTAKIEMLTAGVPMVPLSAASTTSATGDPLGHRRGPAAARVVVLLQPLAHLVGDRVGAPVGVRDVEVGDDERGHELREAEQDAQVHVAEDRGGHEVVRVRREQDV